MIIKFYKTIHNKFSRFFKFIFFLRYLFTIFFVSIAAFLIIPNFFNYEKRTEVIKSHLLKNYNIEVKKHEKISFEALPLPKILVKNALINFENSENNLRVKNFKIFPKFISIYNYDNFDSNKIFLEDSKITLEALEIKPFVKNFLNQKKKIILKNLELNISDKNKSVFKFKNIRYSNFGYDKNSITGIVFGKKVKIKIENEFENINFKILNSGVIININFLAKQKENLISGILKSKILNTNLKFNFDYDIKKVKIYNSYLRSKNISLNGESLIILKPFLDFYSKFNIEEINPQIIKKINFDKLLNYKNLIKKINSKNEINLEPKKFSQDFINDLNLKIDLAYGRLNYIKKISINEGLFKCKGNINLLDEFPLLFFDCSIILKDKKKFLKKFSIRAKTSESLDLKAKGNLSLVNKKINFKSVLLNDVISSKEDLKFYNNSFENIFMNNNFIDIFNLKKIKKFILETT